MKKKNLRDSNYELLRIISMFFIVLYHIIVHSHILDYTRGVSNFVLNGFVFLIMIHVNLFMLITGYYQSKSTFKLKKLIKLLLEVWFYNIVINSILSIAGLVTYTNDDYLTKIMFYNIESYWYISCYIIIYILSPFINKFIESIDKNTLKKLVLIMIFCFSVFPFITGNTFYSTNGLTLVQYIMLYFIGSYIRKFSVNKKILKKFNITQKRAIYISIYILCFIFNMSIYYLHIYLEGLDSNILHHLSKNIGFYKYYYNHPLIIVQSISFFLLFGTFSFKNKIINKISSFTLGIYFITESFYIKVNLYKWIKIDTGRIIYGKSIILKIFIWAIIIFTLCAIIEWLRQLLFKIISKWKITKKLDNKFMTWLTNLLEVK